MTFESMRISKMKASQSKYPISSYHNQDISLSLNTFVASHCLTEWNEPGDPCSQCMLLKEKFLICSRVIIDKSH